MDELPDFEALVSLLVKCMEVGQWNQVKLADVLGVSARTVSRWMNGHMVILIAGHYQKLARALYPRDPAFAAELAAMGGTTLQALGAFPAPASTAAPAGLSPVSQGVPRAARVLANALIGAVAEKSDLPSRQLRPILAAAFAEARELGLSIEDCARAFAEGRAG